MSKNKEKYLTTSFNNYFSKFNNVIKTFNRLYMLQLTYETTHRQDKKSTLSKLDQVLYIYIYKEKERENKKLSTNYRFR